MLVLAALLAVLLSWAVFAAFSHKQAFSLSKLQCSLNLDFNAWRQNIKLPNSAQKYSTGIFSVNLCDETWTHFFLLSVLTSAWSTWQVTGDLTKCYYDRVGWISGCGRRLAPTHRQIPHIFGSTPSFDSSGFSSESSAEHGGSAPGARTAEQLAHSSSYGMQEINGITRSPPLLFVG